MSLLMNSIMEEEKKIIKKGEDDDILMMMKKDSSSIDNDDVKKASEIRLENDLVGNLKKNDVDMVDSVEVETKEEKERVDSEGGENNSVDNEAKRLEKNGVIVDTDEEKKKRGEKRVLEENNVGNKNKKKKNTRVVENDSIEDMKRVAEIVLVLSAMGNMRGGRNPTDAEIQFMAEAREKLVGLCEGIAPKDIVPRDAVRVVIEDLGINRPKDQRLGFRPPMMSIKEKWQLTQRKMEESKKFALQSGIYTSTTVQAGFGSKTDSHGAFAHSTQRFPPERPSHIAVSTGAFQTTTSMVHGNEVQSTTRGQLSNPLERDASSLSVPRTEAQHFRVDGRSNVSAHASQVRANSSGDNLLGKPPATSQQLQLGAGARVGLPNKVPDQKVGGAPVSGVSQIAPPDSRDRKSNPPVSQTVYGNLQAVQHPLQGLNFVQASATNTNHNEISKIVQKFLHPRLPQHPNWTPPSTDYMNKSLACQICKISITDVESVLVCDACERGAHVKCINSFNQKGIPKGEWHCPNCLLQSNGKPLPPKYGRVTRNNPAPNVPPNAAAGQASAEKKAESSNQKVIQKAAANGNPGSLYPSHVSPAVGFRVVTASDPKMLNSREAAAAKSPADKVKMGDDHLSENKALLKNTGSMCAPSSGKPNESANQKFQSRVCKAEEPLPDPKSLPKCEPAVCTDKLSEAGTDNRSQDDVRTKSAEVSSGRSNSTKMPDSVDASECKPGLDVRKDGRDAAQTVSIGNLGVGNVARDCVKSSLDGLHSVEWVGDILQVVDEKAFYKSCHINGMVYKLHDHALFRSNNGSLRPSKLQALWEDTKTGSKWAIVNSCYFPADLPEVVGRPCSPEINEVYESNHGSTVRAGLVQGTCEVLPPNKFKEESERRIRSDNGSQPLFLCKWFYDESKGLFRPVTD